MEKLIGKKRLLEYSQVARQPFLIRSFKGSNPFIPTAIITTNMKILKNIKITSNGNLYFCNCTEVLHTNKFFDFHKRDEKNFKFNQKQTKNNIDSKQSFYSKKKYLKR